MRWLLLVHRWLGILAGWLLLAWCISGVVLMYVPYPSLSSSEQLRGLVPLDLTGVPWHLSSEPVADLPVDGFRLEMMGAQPILRVATLWGESTVKLAGGEPVSEIAPAAAEGVARTFGKAWGLSGEPRYLGPVERDQWTVTANYDAHRPLHRFTFEGGTQIYVSSATGEVMQMTTATERYLGWFGAVTHWLYPTLLRQNVSLWIQTVAWTSLAGIFLTVVGLYIGIAKFRRRKSGRWSPYHGISLWHHYLGLAFGLLTLTWVFSGFLSVNPFGLLQSSGVGQEADRLVDYELTWAEAYERVERLEPAALPPDTVRLETAPFAGKLYYLAHGSDGSAVRLNADTLAPAPLSEQELALAAERLQPDTKVLSGELLTSGDAYYFDHHVKRRFPVYRVILQNDERTRYYLDATSGQILRRTDAKGRWYRWLFEGLHRLDFTPTMRSRPLWDAIMWVLMSGVTGVCFTGTYMAVRHLRRLWRRAATMRDADAMRMTT